MNINNPFLSVKKLTSFPKINWVKFLESAENYFKISKFKQIGIRQSFVSYVFLLKNSYTENTCSWGGKKKHTQNKQTNIFVLFLIVCMGNIDSIV